MITTTHAVMYSFATVLVVIVAVMYGGTEVDSKSSADDQFDIFSESYRDMTSSNRASSQRDAPSRIAIVGAGIGGSTSALFLRSLFGDNTTIEVFEPAARLCGRVATIDFHERQYECGGSVIHPANLYAQSLASHFGLAHCNESSKNGISFWGDGDKSEFDISNSNFFLVVCKLLWNFGWSVVTMFRLINDYLTHFATIYQLQVQGKSYGSVEELLFAFGGEPFVQSTQQTGCEMFAEAGIANKTIDLLINGAMKVNYGQDCRINGFAGSVGIAGFMPGLWAVHGGNNQLCEKSFASSGASLIGNAVTKIKHLENNFQVQTKDGGEHDPYDVVVLATPMYFNGPDIDLTEACSDIDHCPNNKTPAKSYRSTVATFVYGKLNGTTFDCSGDDCPNSVIKVIDAFYRSVGLQQPVDFDPTQDAEMSPTNEAVYKVFSTNSLTSEQLHELFEVYSEVDEVVWKAYPKFSPPEELGKFVLHPSGLYYTSPVEWSASAIEMSIVSAKNAALLAYNRWYDI